MITEDTTNIEEAIGFPLTLDTSDGDRGGSNPWEESEETSEALWQVHQSWGTAITSDEPEWTSEIEEVDDTDTAAVLDSVWATKAAVVEGLWYYSKEATKHVVVDGILEEVPNDSARIDALKTLAKLHFDKQFRTVKRNKKLNVILIRDGQ